jgi:1-acyl-sn-glycerol-3-phosphate acyltransferase
MDRPRPTLHATLDPEALLGVIHALAVELHPQRAAELRVTLDSSLEADLAFDSLTRMELLARIEQQLGIALPEQAVALAETPGDLLRAVAIAGAHAADAAPRPAFVPGAAPAPELAAGAEVGAPAQAATLPEVLEWHVARQPGRTHILFYEEDAPVELTYEGLWTGAREVATGLLREGVREGDRVAIMLPTGFDYLFGFFGTMLAAAVPVPIYPPARPSQIEDHLRRHAGILSNAGVVVLIAPAEAQPVAKLLRMHVESLRSIPTVAELRANAESPGRPALRGDAIAYLQYTSGSTGQPKGVVLSHANVLANIRAMGAVLKAGSRDVFVSWLPLYHDMGLIGAWLGSLYYGTPLVLMSPLRFLARPERWLQAIHRHRGTLSGGPNFAYELCVRLARESGLQGLDLSCWRVAFNGAEPVIPETVQRFNERFAPVGFRAEALMPVYGLAEDGVGLAFPPLGRGPWIDRVSRDALMRDGRAEPAVPEDAHALRFPSCGMVLPGHELRVMNEAGAELGEREEGRIEFRGPSATRGYFRNPEATQALLKRGWLDSGDVGYLARGEIFLTGRRKDIIIRGGRNIYPHELEEAIGEIDGIRKGSVAVFGTADTVGGTERVVALAETRFADPARRDALRRAVDAAAMALLGTPLDDVVLAQPHTVPKTSSGKIRRAASRELYERGLGKVRRRAVRWQILRLRLSGLAPGARRLRRLAADRLFGVWGLATVAAVALPVWLLVAAAPRPAAAWAVLRGAARLLFRLWGAGLAVRGVEQLPAGEPCILMLNHSSYLDGLVIAAAFPGAWSFVAKRELVRNWAIRVFLDRLGTLYVERFDAQRSAEDARGIAHAARKGRSLVYFPEGTFSRMPGLLPFYLGGFAAAVEAGLPVVPAALRGTRSMLRDGQWLLRRGLLSVTVCPALRTEGLGFSAAVLLRDRTRAALLPLVGEPDLAAETGMVARLAPGADSGKAR